MLIKHHTNTLKSYFTNDCIMVIIHHCYCVGFNSSAHGEAGGVAVQGVLAGETEINAKQLEKN